MHTVDRDVVTSKNTDNEKSVLQQIHEGILIKSVLAFVGVGRGDGGLTSTMGGVGDALENPKLLDRIYSCQ